MAFVIYTKDDSTLGIFQQTAYNTAAPAASAFIELPNAAIGIDNDVLGRRPDRSRTSVDGASRQVDVRDITHDTKGNSPKLIHSGDVRLADLGYYLYGVMQNVTEAAATPYKKIFTFPATQPDLTAIAAVSSPGILFGVCAKHPVASTSELISDAIIPELTLSCAPGAGDDRLQAAKTFAGRGPLDEDFNPTGTWTRATETHFPFHNLGGFKTNFGGAVSQNLLSYEVTIRNNAAPIGVDANPTATWKFKSFALGMPYQATGKFVIPYDTAADTLLSNLSTGADGTIDIWWGTEAPAATGDFKISANAVFLPGTGHQYVNGIHVIEFLWESVTDKANSVDDSLTITLCDAQDLNWVTA